MSSALVVLSWIPVSAGENIVFPPDAGVIDVTGPPYNAVPDDGADDAAAIQRALVDHPTNNHVFYFPAGVYDISDALLRRPDDDPLRNRRACLELRGSMKRNIFIGQSENRTVLRLMDTVPADFDKGVIWFGRSPAQRFRNAMRHLTVSIGTGHPRADGVLFNASNQGGLRRVTIRTDDPDGAGGTGLNMAYTGEIGPLLVQHLTVRGFDRGIRCAWQTASQTFEHVTLRGQREYGFTVGFSQSVFIRGLDFAGPCTAVRSGPTVTGDPGQARLLLVGAQLQYTGDGDPPAAVRNQKWGFFRDIAAEGFRAVVTRELDHGRGNPTVTESPLDEFIANGREHKRRGPPFQLFPSPPRSLDLPVEEPPAMPWETDLSRWAGPHRFRTGKKGTGCGFPDDPADDTAAIQAAIDSGATTVYLPRGTWRIAGTLLLRGRVRHFLGCEARLNPVTGSKPVVALAGGDAPAVLVEGLESGGVRFTHAAGRTLHLRHLLGGRYRAPASGPAGDLFLTDVTFGPTTVGRGQRLWARQLDIEGDTTSDPDGEAKVVNNGGTAWILGMKTEDAGTVIKTVNGGRTELLGHLHVGGAGGGPCFIVEDADFTAALSAAPRFPIAARETRNGVTREAKDFSRADLYCARRR